MKALNSIILAVIIFGNQLYAADFFETNDRITSALRIRAEPISTADVVGSPFPGQQLPLLSKDISYSYEIQRPNGQPDYVSKGYSWLVSQSVLFSTTAENGSSVESVDYIDSGESIPNYQLQRRGTATHQAFIDAAVAQSKTAGWDSTLATEKIVAELEKSFSDRPDIIFEATRYQLPDDDVGQTYNIPFSNVGAIKGAIFLRINGNSATGNWGDAYAAPGFSIGFTDGTNQWCTTFRGDPEVTGDQESWRSQVNHNAVMRDNQGGSADNEAVQGEWKLNSLGTNTLQIEVTHNDDYPRGEIRNVVVIAIGGDDVGEVVIGSYDDMGTVTTSQPISVGHKPDLVFTSGTLDNIIHDDVGVSGRTVNRADSMMTFGVAAETIDGLKQMGYSYYMDDGISPAIDPSQVASAIYNDAVMAKLRDGGTENYSIAIDEFTGDGFNVSQSASGDGAIFGYMSISFKKRPKMNMVDTIYPPSGNYSITDLGFKGGFGFWLNLAGATAYNTAEDINNSLGITVFDIFNTYTVNAAMAANHTQADNLGQSYGNDEFSLLVKGAGTSVLVDSSKNSFTDNGVDWRGNTDSGETIRGRMLVMGIN